MKGVTPRALILGLFAVAAACLLVCWADLVIAYMQLGILQFPPGAVGLLIFIYLGNSLLRRLCRRWGLTGTEILTVYSMVLVGVMVASRGLMDKWFGTLVGVNYLATPENGWRRIFYPHIRPWLVPFDPAGPEKQPVSVGMYEGLAEGQAIPWGQWALPIATWGVFVLLVFWGFLCLASLVRRQWVDNEKLTFPLVALPLELAREGGQEHFLRNRLTWVGFALATAIFTLNGLHMIWPSLPYVRTDFNVHEWLPPTLPWTGIFYTPMLCSLAAVGFFYMLPLDLVFSLWFFFVLTRVQDYLYTRAGMDMAAMPLYPTHLMQGYQVMGAYFVLVVYLVRSGWPQARAILRKALTGDRAVDDGNELLPYRTAAWGLVISFVGTVAWCCLAGMSLWVAALEMGVYLFVVALVMARSVAEGGLLMTETSFRPLDVVNLVSNRALLGPANLTALSFTDAVFARDLRGLLVTGFLDSARMADGTGQRRRSLVGTLVGAVLLAMVAAGFLHLFLPYTRGALSLYPYPYQANNIWGFQENAALIGAPAPFDVRAPAFFLVGVVVTTCLAVARSRWPWFPLHPLGYAVSASWTMIVFWWPCFLAWVLKGLIQHYGGMKGYRRARPFFLGLILGEFASAIAWAAFSLITRQPAPAFPWP